MSWVKSIYSGFKMALTMILLMVFAIISISAVKKQSNEKVRAIAIDIQGNGLLTKPDVIALFKKHFGKKYSSKTINETDLLHMETVLNQDLYIERSNAFLDRNNKIHLDIIECNPLFRLIEKSGKEYYIDKKQRKIPTQIGRSLRIPIITIDINARTEPGLKEMVELVILLNDDHFLKALVEQIHIGSNQIIWIIPKIGKEKIQLGELIDLESKLNRLKVFYKQGLSVKGWNQYKEINISFKDQVVCTKL